MGQYDQAITEALNRLELYPNNRGVLSILWEAYLESGMIEEATNTCNQMEKLGSLRWKICIGQTSAVSRKRTEAQEVLDELIAQWEREQRVGIARIIAAIYARLGEHSKALDWLERLYAARSLYLIDIKSMNAFYSLRSEPRFQALLEKMGMD